MKLDALAAATRAQALEVFGTLDCTGDAAAPEGARSIVLLGPHEPGFWSIVTASPEFADGSADPLDRWSTRVISNLARSLGGTSIFPFGGPPYAPFQRWAVETGRAWISPVGLLVHDRAGLWTSFRGAIALPFTLDHQTTENPCQTCADRPCVSACPVAALTGNGYDLSACHTYLDGPGRNTCLANGCDVRRSCPAGADYGRLPVQSAYHMGQFHR